MIAKKWSDIRGQRFTPEELRQIDEEIESEVLVSNLSEDRPSDTACAV